MLDKHSRFRFSEQLTDPDGNLYLTEPEPFGFVDLPDNRKHVVTQGETLWGLAEQYFSGEKNAQSLFWVIADFQPDPITDPTQELEPNRVLFIPSRRTLDERIFSESRRPR